MRFKEVYKRWTESRLTQEEAALLLGSMLPGTAVGRDQPPSEIGCHRLASDGWKIELEKGIVDHGSVMLSLLGKKDASTTSFYPITTTYVTSASTTSTRTE